MTIKKDEIDKVAGGTFFKSVLGREELTFSPIDATSTLDVDSNLYVNPAEGQFVYYAFNVEYLFKIPSTQKGVGKYIGYLHFSDINDTLDNRLTSWSAISLDSSGTALVTVVRALVAADGRISLRLENTSATAGGWAKAVLTVGGPYITVA